MIKLTCMYCGNNCDKVHPTSMWYGCKSCDAHFYESDEGDRGVTFYHDIKGKRYRLEILLNRPKTWLFLIKPGFDTLYETNNTINVTPGTALEKIKHILTFL